MIHNPEALINDFSASYGDPCTAEPKWLWGFAILLAIVLLAGCTTSEPTATLSVVAVYPGGSVAGVAELAGPGTVYFETAKGSGSGVLFHPSGYVLTNAHVVDDDYLRTICCDLQRAHCSIF